MLLDYEYASMNDECYDLGIWSAVNYFTEAMEHELIKYYYGHHDEKKFAKLKLQISATSNYVGQQPFKIIAFW